MGAAEFNKDGENDEYKVKIVDGGKYKEPGGAIRKPSQDEIDAYKIHRIIVMTIFGLVVVILLLLIIILMATTEGCESMNEDKLPWYKSGVIYNIYPRSFKDSGDDGIGDFKGIKDKLGYLEELGVNILYLSSVFQINTTVDYGYSVIDFKNTNPEYGTLKDFENLVDSAHAKNMKVIIEFMPCETSILHEWFLESNKNSSKREWYVWQDNVPTGDGNNYSPGLINGSFYRHPANYSQKASLNWDNDAVKTEMQGVLGFWLDKKVDGFRVVSIERLFGSNYTLSEQNKIHAIVQKWKNFTTKRNPDSILMGSTHPANLSSYGMKKNPELDIIVKYLVPHDGNYTAEKFKDLIMEKLSENNWPSWALTSWVHERVGSKVSSKLACSLGALLLTIPGTPIVFYGDEIGMQNVNNSGNAPMQWDNSKNAGFTMGNSTWFGAVGNYNYTNVKHDQLGIKKVFIDALKLRKENEGAFLDGPLSNFTIITEQNVAAFTFADDPSRFAMVLNFGNIEGQINISRLGIKRAKVKFHTADKEPEEIPISGFKVPPEVFYVLEPY